MRGAVRAYGIVEAALGVRSTNESLSGAAFRVTRENCAPPHVLDIARRVLGATGKLGVRQWEVLYECADIIVKHDQTKGKGDASARPDDAG
jgi:hypothetical protein